jgi:hypothetical protein
MDCLPIFTLITICITSVIEGLRTCRSQLNRSGEIANGVRVLALHLVGKAPIEECHLVVLIELESPIVVLNGITVLP